MTYESILGSYLGSPMPYSNYKKPYLVRVSFDNFPTKTPTLVSTGDYKFFTLPFEHTDPVSGQKFPESLVPLMGAVYTSVSILTDFTGAGVTADTYGLYLDVENKKSRTSSGEDAYVEITARQRNTPPGGANPPQAWVQFSRPLVNNLPQATIPVLYYEMEFEIPATLATSLSFPVLGNDNWCNMHEIKRGHGQNPSTLAYNSDAGDMRLIVGVRRDAITGLLDWVIQIDDGANNGGFTLDGVASTGDIFRTFREIFTPGASAFLGKRIILRVYIKDPANNADRTSGITYITITDKDTNTTQVLAKFIGGELMGLYSLPYGRIFFGIYSGGATPYSNKIYNLTFSDQYAFDEAVFSEKFKYDDAMCYLPLTNSLNPQRGYGMGAFTRATVATVFDNTGKLITVPSGVPRFEGARYVQNLLSSSDVLATQGVSVNADTYTISFIGVGTIAFSGAYAGADLVGTSYNTRVNRTFSASAGTLTLTVTGTVNLAQLEVGANVSEYVSKGSTSIGANYHGLVIDGIKAFNTNINGTAISSSILKGLLINHQSRTNNLLWCRDLTNAAWTIGNMAVTKDQIGIDGYPSVCSKLTASSANATILQTIITAAVAASSSAYVKRSVGTGRVFFTRDGGSNWTEITSSINSSTFTRVKIENTSVLNPQIGFKIETSADAIIVDYVQNEAGVEASMPIYTTSGAATRNAEVLNYPALHNFNTYYNAAKYGLICATFESLNWTTASGSLVGSSTAGLFVSNANSGVQAKDGTNTVNGPTGIPTGSKKLGVRFDVGTLEAVSDNSWSSVGVYDGDFGQGGESLTWLAICTGCSGYVKDVCIWNTPITNQQVYDITNP